MNTLEKAELTASIHHIKRFSKSGILIYNSEIPDTLLEKQQEVSEDIGVCVLNLQTI